MPQFYYREANVACIFLISCLMCFLKDHQSSWKSYCLSGHNRFQSYFAIKEKHGEISAIVYCFIPIKSAVNVFCTKWNCENGCIFTGKCKQSSCHNVTLLQSPQRFLWYSGAWLRYNCLDFWVILAVQSL